MNNFVAYFYNIPVDKLTVNRDYYAFNYHGYWYHLYQIDDDSKIDMLANLSKQLSNYTLVSEIVINKDGNYVSNYNDTKYVLLKIYVNSNKKISLDEITYLANLMYSYKRVSDWGILWANKIDYWENIINESGKKYPLLVDSFNYFVGMAENAISYYNDINIDNTKYVISHKIIRFDDTVCALYNPLNIIFDYRARDIAEYIKNSFFINNTGIFDEMKYYIKRNHLTYEDVRLIIARLLYPSFYFEMCEDILIYNQSETIITKVTDKLSQYEEYLFKIITFFREYYAVPNITWLNNKNED